MKKALLIPFAVCLPLIGLAQPQLPWVRPLPPPDIHPNPKNPGIGFPGALIKLERVDSLSNGNVLYRLSQDGMPCVVPDLSTYNMPVKQPPLGTIMPNPALRLPFVKPIIPYFTPLQKRRQT